MPARNVDIVFCLDISDSMKPCIDAVRDHIDSLLHQLQATNFSWRLGLLAHHMPGKRVYHTETLKSHDSCESLDCLYGRKGSEEELFTTDIAQFRRALNAVCVAGDENMLCALDMALDFPFGPTNTTQRVVILISDEPFETNEPSAFAEAKEKVEDIMEKIQARHITFLAVMPVREDGVAEKLAMVDRADIIPVEEGDLGMRNVDMKGLLSQLGRTISVTTMQSSEERAYKRALFGQDRWVAISSFSRIGDSK